MFMVPYVHLANAVLEKKSNQTTKDHATTRPWTDTTHKDSAQGVPVLVTETATVPQPAILVEQPLQCVLASMQNCLSLLFLNAA
jgi:hypothetical protein